MCYAILTVLLTSYPWPNWEMARWLERDFTDRKVRGPNPTSPSQLPLSRLGQPGSISALVLPSGGMEVLQHFARGVYFVFTPYSVATTTTLSSWGTSARRKPQFSISLPFTLNPNCKQFMQYTHLQANLVAGFCRMHIHVTFV
ncbi:hypothetical protein CSKR_113270 [Clonorchis sinensis]|uniref:Uncharacterized protein n=1 Tax=Clonorchis sinensis TaxID=79923 RepID=A0A419QAL6_CLOSI|nr:hypothetical protein CSKR_113270 [Clonorchis sinensis]